jgi:peptide/nickel transport system substrate-binding protein
MRTSRAVVVLLVAVLGTAGCSSHTDRPKTDPCTIHYFAGSGSDTTSCDDPAQSGKGPVQVPGASPGGTVTVLTHDGLQGTLDPTDASEPDVVSVMSGLITRSLTQYRYDATSHQMALVPDLATDLGRHNDNYTIWEFTLRHGARFEDGSRVTTPDVVRGVRRCLRDRRLPVSPCRATGLRSVSVRRYSASEALRFRFTRPFPDLPYLVASPAFGPVPARAAADPTAYAEHPLATGPYRIQSYRRGHRLVLVRNPQWDPVTDPVRTEYPDRYVVRAGLSRARIEHLLVADLGSAQTTLTYDTVDTTRFRAAGGSDRVVLGPTSCTTYLAPDNRTVTDPRVRRALLWAYPYRAVLRAEGLVPGVTAVPATGLLPPVADGRTPYRTPGHRPFATEPGVAHRMLAHAHALGTRLRFPFTPGDAASLRTRDALVRALRAGGFDPQPVHVSTILPVDLRTATQCGAWPRSGQWLGPVYGPVSTGAGDDVARFDQPVVDRDLRRIESIPLEQMGPAWSQLDRMVLRRWSPVVPLWYGGVAMAHGSRIEGMADDSVHGMPTWQGISVRP